jgi:hypothetical protein
MTEPKKKQPTDKVVVKVSEVDELRNAVVGLAGRVNSLSEALTTVNDIQIRQIATERETTAIKKTATEAAKTVRAVEEIVVPRDEHEKRWRAEQEDLIRLRKQIRRKTYIVGTIYFILSLALLSLATGLILWNQSQQHKITQTACETRKNASRDAAVAYKRILDHSPTLQKDSDLRALITAAYGSAVRGAKVTC